jgi:hypothetical protein
VVLSLSFCIAFLSYALHNVWLCQAVRQAHCLQLNQLARLSSAAQLFNSTQTPKDEQWQNAPQLS